MEYNEISYYKVLEVSRIARQSEIKEAWKKKLREYDVDKLKYFGEKLVNLAKEETQLINEAYEILSDSEKRKAYNQTIGKRTGCQSGIEKIQNRKKYVQKQSDIHNNRAIRYWQESQHEKAIAEWKAGIKHAPSVYELYHNLANAYLNLERYDEAVEACISLIKAHPNSAEAYLNLGSIYSHIGETKLAAKSWQKAIEIDPNCVEMSGKVERQIANSIGNNSKRGIFSRAFGKFRKKT